ncbi:hypothetical protein [Arsenicibacter rosenii]|uniref:Capsule assembly Wzi family protein n=1 Tax=Arsenicibacter rosenii TaxID=1750698 RepID=A0A1S2VN80_9BACT|nr:hypothetical protein [Arsenicibacter rosenii]OIN60219.1 hypothetical protein BLX24_05125 [Arsenicibacter rosenii]
MKKPLPVLAGCLIGFCSSALAQSPYIPLNTDYYHLIDRMEIRQGRWSEGFHSSFKAYNRQSVIQLTDSVLTNQDYPLSATDRFNLGYLRDDSWEWIKPIADSVKVDPLARHSIVAGTQQGDSEKPLFGIFYKKKSDFYSLQTPELDLHVSPVIYLDYTREAGNNNLLYTNTRGLEVRGTIMKKLGFYTYFADNQAYYPKYIQEYGQVYARQETDAGFAPGEGLAKLYRNRGADFLAARGHFTFNVLKAINVQFGHDRNFIGNGYRSLFLSDNAAPYLFLKLTTRFGKRFQYTNLFTELQNVQASIPANELVPQKYMAMHHLSVNLTKNINLGVFEAVVYSRDRLELGYLNPVILYRFVESYRGSADNTLAGIDLKVNFLKHFMAYGQILLDEFRISDLRAGNGSWTNKYATQAGLKYIDAFGIQNLDLQGEFNMARPYTYSHFGGQTNYVHYNQPLAHPLGANFFEWLGIARFQHQRLTVSGLFSVMQYGDDPPGRNYGRDILKNYDTRFRSEGNFIGQGRQTIISYAEGRASYMFKHNLFLDARYTYRLRSSQFRSSEYASNLLTFGARWNFAYRNLVY